MKVLLADDDRDLVDLLRYAFHRDGHNVVMAFDGEAAWRTFQSESPDLVVLDMMMPKRNGTQVLREIRRVGKTPVIVLTALGDEDRVVNTFEIGADDYVVKPFRPRELMARAQALVRRSREQGNGNHRATQPIELGAIRLDPGARAVSIAGNPVQLTRTEFALLHHLMLNRDTIVPTSDIIAAVWGFDAEGNDEVVKVAVSRLRRKIEPNPAHPRYIINCPGVGYQFQSKV